VVLFQRPNFPARFALSIKFLVCEFFVAFFTIQFDANERLSSFCTEDPFTLDQGWVVTAVLTVPAFEIGDPMIFFILMKRYNFSQHWGYVL
jgi:hypothetical protein